MEKTTVVFELIITMRHQTRISLGSWSKYGIVDALPLFTMSAVGHYFRI